VLTAPDDCPKCGEYMKGDEKRLNLKFYFKRKKCFSCVLKEEREIKNRGAEAWDEYQRKIMLDNAEAWFRDCDIEVDILKDQVKEAYWHNADGRSDDIDITQFVERMQKDYGELKETIRKNLTKSDKEKTDNNNLG
jgi:DNA-directed RNA polymerase subunit M/transcription elongation factor TFIIS